MKATKIILILALWSLSHGLSAQLNPFLDSYSIDQEDIDFARSIIEKKAEKLIFPNPQPGAQWYQKGSLGLMMHWGPHSVLGAQPSWDMVPMEASWGGAISPPERYYEETLKVFNPRNYNPGKFLAAAKNAGFTYAVLTTKHHDGYAIWPSKYGLSTKQYLGGRDLLKPYVDACRKAQLKVGFYYSPRDWYYPGYPEAPVRLKGLSAPVSGKEEFEKFLAFTLRQLKELLTEYGKIDILWFDSFGWPGETNYYNQQVYSWVRSLQPDIVINDRWHDLTNPDEPKELLAYGDFQTPFECHLPDYKPKGWWENVEIWTNGRAGWGYDTNGDFKSWQWFFTYFLTTRSMGGNLLLNASPGPDGEMHPAFYEWTSKLAKWMGTGKESVIGTDPSPGNEWSNVPITTRPGVWYLHLLPGFKGQVMVRLSGLPKSVTLINPGKPLDYDFKSGILRISVPDNFRSDMDDVIKIML